MCLVLLVVSSFPSFLLDVASWSRGGGYCRLLFCVRAYSWQSEWGRVVLGRVSGKIVWRDDGDGWKCEWKWLASLFHEPLALSRMFTKLPGSQPKMNRPKKFICIGDLKLACSDKSRRVMKPPPTEFKQVFFDNCSFILKLFDIINN